jgi:uncharacterized protein YfaP (DUF2135 family)
MEEIGVSRSTCALLLLTLVPFLLLSCSSSDDPVTPPAPSGPETNENIEEALSGYWGSTETLNTSMSNLNSIMDQIETTFDEQKLSKVDGFNDQITAYVDQYVAETIISGAAFDGLIARENAIYAYGAQEAAFAPADATGVENMFTDVAGAVVKGVFNVGKKIVVDSGRMVRTSWRILSGSHTLRDALRSPDSGIPIVSDMAKRLKEHNAARDRRIIESIESGDSQEGWVPISELEGSTAADRANYYRNLPDDHSLKKSTRGDVHLWDREEATETVKTIKKVAKDQIKNYAGAGGNDFVNEVTEQLLTIGQNPEDKGSVTTKVKDADTESAVTEDIMIIISKRNQPISELKLAIITGAPADLELELPAGTYDIVVAAEDYIRSVATSVAVSAQDAFEVASEMLKYSSHSIILEEIAVTPEQGIVGGIVTARVAAVSLTGAALTFDWTVTGPGVGTVTRDGVTCSFTPTAMGDYTISVTATDSNSNSKTKTATASVVDVGVDIAEYTITSEELNDNNWNPGETVGVTLHVGNTSGAEITGNMSISGEEGVTATGTLSGVTLPVSGTTDFPITVVVPNDYSSDTATLIFNFTTVDGLGNPVTVSTAVDFDVDFYVEINEITSPVTERVLTLYGKVANPSLTTATLVIDGDSDQAFEVGLNSGTFSQEVAVEASAEEESHTVEIVAWSGSWEERGSASFTSQVPPAGFRVTLTWNTGGTDVDLWTTDPDGEKCYYGNRQTASLLSLDVDNTSGYGPENITAGVPIAGDYLVQVHYFSDHDSEEAIATSCSVIIRLNEGTPEEETRTYYGGLSDSGDMWTVTTITIGEKGLYNFTDKPEYGFCDPATLPAK